MLYNLPATPGSDVGKFVKSICEPSNSKLLPIIAPLELILPEAVIWPVKCDFPSISKSPS